MNKKTTILNSALKLFVECGEQATSMKLIAEKANCGIGTMYNYFPSKDDLINELYLETKIKLFNFISKALDTKIPVKKQFINIWIIFIEFAIENPLEYKFLEIFSHSPLISKKTTEKVYKLLYPLFEIFEQGKREGLIKNIDTLQLIIFTNGAITASIINNTNISEQKINEIAMMAWDAIKN